MKTVLALLAMTAVAYGESVTTVAPTATVRTETVAVPTETATASVAVPTDAPATAAAVRGAPIPGDEHGRTDALDTGDSLARQVGRTLLFIPRVSIQLAAQPARGWFYLQDRYSILRVVQSQFQTDDRKLSLFPTAFFETGFGLNVGVRARIKDVFGHGERIAFRAAIGGQFKRIVALDAESKGQLRGGIRLRYQVTQDHFYGYGNGEVTTLVTPIDPLASDDSVATNFRTHVRRLAPYVKFDLTPELAVTATGALTDKSFAVSAASSSGMPVDTGFDVTKLPGFERGTRFHYEELEVAWDTRRSATEWDPPGMRTTGGLMLGFVGRQDGFRNAEPAFYRAGFDLQKFVRISQGPRVLELRALGEMVTGARDEVPFSELPRLGGSAVLRGYAGDRFRDRVAVVAQASYMWAAANWLAPSLFVDVGRVYSGLDDLSLQHPRVAFGTALELYQSSGMLTRFQISTSLEGGTFVFLTFNPVFDARSRVERH